MSMTGAIVNALAIVAGGAVGLLFQRGIPERVSKTVMIGLGLCVLYIGISGAFACQSILIVIVAMTLGAAAGALLNIDGAIHRLGTWVEAHVHRHEGGPSLAEGFVTASLLCCVGAMAVNGSLDAGIRGDNSILLTKSMIDLVFCAMLATTLGAGVLLAGAAVFVVEGALTLLAGAIAPLLSEAAVADLTCAARGGHRPQSDRRDEDQGGGLFAGAAVRAPHPLAGQPAGLAAGRRVVLSDTI